MSCMYLSYSLLFFSSLLFSSLLFSSHHISLPLKSSSYRRPCFPSLLLLSMFLSILQVTEWGADDKSRIHHEGNGRLHTKRCWWVVMAMFVLFYIPIQVFFHDTREGQVNGRARREEKGEKESSEGLFCSLSITPYNSL